MLHGSEYWVIDRKLKQRTSVAVMGMLRWMSAVVREDRMRNEYVRGCFKNGQNEKKNRLRWFGHVTRGEESKALTMVMKINVGGKTERGQQKKK